MSHIIRTNIVLDRGQVTATKDGVTVEDNGIYVLLDSRLMDRILRAYKRANDAPDLEAVRRSFSGGAA